MKLTAILAAVVLGAAPVLADMTVVQKVESSLTAGKASATTMTLKIKGTKAKIEFSPEPRSALIDLQAGKIYMFDQSAKQAVAMSLAQMKQAIALAGQPAEKADAASFQKTGNTKTINGFKCQEYSLSSAALGGGRMSCWMAEDVDAGELEPFREFALDVARLGSQAALARMKGMLIACEADARLQVADTRNRLEVQSISRDPIDAAVFALPSDCKIMEMPALSPAAPPPPKAGSPSP